MRKTDISVKVKKNDSREIDKALRKLKRIMDDEGILKELKDRRHFEKPCDKAKRKKADARKRVAKERRMQKKGYNVSA